MKVEIEAFPLPTARRYHVAADLWKYRELELDLRGFGKVGWVGRSGKLEKNDGNR